jgi:hypothetical protein
LAEPRIFEEHVTVIGLISRTTTAQEALMKLEECFQILGIEPTDSISKIKSAYRDLLFVWHPDRFPDDPRLQAKAHERLREINEAYNLLIQYLDFKEQEKRSRTTVHPPQQENHHTEPPTQNREKTEPPPSSVNRPPRHGPTPDPAKRSIWNTPIKAEYLIPPLLVALVIFGLGVASIGNNPKKPTRISAPEREPRIIVVNRVLAEAKEMYNQKRIEEAILHLERNSADDTFQVRIDNALKEYRAAVATPVPTLTSYSTPAL